MPATLRLNLNILIATSALALGPAALQAQPMSHTSVNVQMGGEASVKANTSETQGTPCAPCPVCQTMPGAAATSASTTSVQVQQPSGKQGSGQSSMIDVRTSQPAATPDQAQTPQNTVGKNETQGDVNVQMRMPGINVHVQMPSEDVFGPSDTQDDLMHEGN